MDSLPPSQKAELILDPDSGALEDKAIIMEVFKSLTESRDDEQLNQFFQAFADISKQVNASLLRLSDSFLGKYGKQAM